MKVDTEVAPRSAERFGIRSIPTLIFFSDGEPLFEMVGLVPKPVLEREIGLLLWRSALSGSSRTLPSWTQESGLRDQASRGISLRRSQATPYRSSPRLRLG